MALSSDTISGLALFSALLAFSSLHCSGPNERAIQFKLSALQSLHDTARKGSLSSVEAAQQVASSMLLGAFDVGYKFRPNGNNGLTFCTDPTTFGEFGRVALVHARSYGYCPDNGSKMPVTRK
jgi:hypothetical protein